MWVYKVIGVFVGVWIFVHCYSKVGGAYNLWLLAGLRGVCVTVFGI